MSAFFGIIGIVLILGLAYLMSNNKKAINWRVIGSAFALQIATAIFVLKTSFGQALFGFLADGIRLILDFSDKGGEFVFGILSQQPDIWDKLFGGHFIFMLKIVPTVIFVAALVNIAYFLGIMQKVISLVAKVVYKLIGVSGSEALSNVSSAFVGQVEAQIMIKPYVKGMTMSELLASMTGSMACIAGGVMAIYISFGVPAEYLLAASAMAAPGALVISKLVWPETQESETKGEIKLEVKKTHVNLIDAISHGASEGMRISINIVAMLIALIALIAMIDYILGGIGSFLATHTALSLDFIGINLESLSLKEVLGALFSGFAYTMGVPFNEASQVGALMGTKVVMTEFIAYTDLAPMIESGVLSAKSIIIASFALCGFANFGSIAIQVGGIGELAPTRRKDLAKLGIKALICGTLTSYISAAIAGILLSL